MTRLTARFLRATRKLTAPGDRVLVALSGGVDSIVLLELLRSHAAELGITVEAAHLDHAMRATSADDAAWVAGYCQVQNVPLHSERAAEPPANEADARSLRYAFLDRIADSIGADRIATGHHADDQVETLLFRLMRGTGLDGLAGIPAERERVIRPLLQVTRAEIEAYARAHALPWREDESNRSLDHARNRIRRVILPSLEQHWPEVRSDLRRLARDAARARAGWACALEELKKNVVRTGDSTSIVLARAALLEYHPEIRRRLLRRWLRDLGVSTSRAGTAALHTFISSGESGSGIDLAGIRVERDFDNIRLRRAGPVERLPDQPLAIENAESGHGVVRLGGTQYQVDWAMARAVADSTTIVLNDAALRFPLLFRSWRPGDRIQLPFGSKKLKKLYAEKRLGREEKRHVPVLVDRDDNVLWIVGLVRASVPATQPAGSGLRITVRNGHAD